MRTIYLIFVCCIMFPCFAGDFDNPYIGYYTATAQMSRDIDVSYMKYYNILSELELNYADASMREQSVANRILGAAAIGLTGFGVMNLMSGLAEQSADADAEKDMKAYMATFVCDYGAGRNINGGTYNVEVPGGNTLTTLATEYRRLAADLKARKEALGLSAGIESEEIIAPADSGLYDNVGVDRQSGAFTSVARSLADENSASAAAWAEQKSDAHSKTKTGATVGGIGAIGGVAGNLLINSSEKVPNK